MNSNMHPFSSICLVQEKPQRNYNFENAEMQPVTLLSL